MCSLCLSNLACWQIVIKTAGGLLHHNHNLHRLRVIGREACQSHSPAFITHYYCSTTDSTLGLWRLLFGSNLIKVYLKQEEVEENESLLKIKTSWLTFSFICCSCRRDQQEPRRLKVPKVTEIFVINTLIDRCTHTILTTQHIFRKRLYNNTNNSKKSSTNIFDKQPQKGIKK